MSSRYNTDGMLVLGGKIDEPKMNVLESIEYSIAFDVTCWSQESRRLAWIYTVIFGVPTDEDEDDDGWHFSDTMKKWGWDERDKQRAIEYHKQWEKAKELLGQTVKWE